MKSRVLVCMLIAMMILTLFGSVVHADEPLDVALIIAGALGDRSFNDSANAGLVRAQEEFGINAKVLECQRDASLYFNQLLFAAENYDVVFLTPGYEFDYEISQIVPYFPDTKFVYVDGICSEPSVASAIFSEHEGSFLAGALAAMLTTHEGIDGINPDTKVIGMVGGQDIPVIRNFFAGYKQGAAAVDPSVRADVVYAGSFDDPAKGKEFTFSLHDRGADIVFQVASKTGEGVISAAVDSGRYAIGVDSDQCYIAPNNMVGSMMKRVDNAVLDLIQTELETGIVRGEVYRYGINEDGVGLCYCDSMLKNVPADIIEKLQEIELAVRAGEIIIEPGN